MWSNVYEESVKYLFANASDRIEMQSRHLKTRFAIVFIFSCLYVVLINQLTTLLLKTVWEKLKDWMKNIDIDKMTYNALAPRPAVARTTGS